MPSAIYIPTTSAEQWAQLLAEPAKQWRQGYSARTIAYSWQEAQGFPVEVGAVLRATGLFKELELLLAIPEHQVPLPGGRRPSQNDIWCLARTPSELVSVAVEGKVDEPFGPTLGEWLTESSPGKLARLAYLKEQLSLSGDLEHGLRYQLLHRAASAVIEARRFLARHAIMLVHSFSPDRRWFADYAAFAALFNVEPEADRLHSVGMRGGINLHIAWICGNPEYRDR